MSVWKAAVLGLGGLLWSGWSVTVQAQTCEQNSDCPKGFTCEVTGGSACASPACAPGEKCPDPAPCEPMVYRSCEPGPCMVDSDCADGMVCYEQKVESCSGGVAAPCLAGQFCPPPTPPVCTTQSQRSCTPRYLLPCTDDNSCGPGFSCKEVTECACAGSAGSSGSGSSSSGGAPTPATPSPTPAQDAGSSSGDAFAPPRPAADGGQEPNQKPAVDAGAPSDGDGGSALPPDGMCGCHSTGQKSCSLNEIVCKADSDCPAHFTCQDQGMPVANDLPCVITPGADASVCGTTKAQPPEPMLRCVPPYANAVRDASHTPELGTSDPVQAPTATGNQGSTSGGGTASATPPTTPGGDPGESDAAPHAKACSVSMPGANTGTSSAWFALAGVAFGLTWLRRRRD